MGKILDHTGSSGTICPRSAVATPHSRRGLRRGWVGFFLGGGGVGVGVGGEWGGVLVVLVIHVGGGRGQTRVTESQRGLGWKVLGWIVVCWLRLGSSG